MAAHYSAQEALEHVFDSSSDSEADFTDLEELESSSCSESTGKLHYYYYKNNNEKMFFIPAPPDSDPLPLDHESPVRYGKMCTTFVHNT